MPAGSYATAWKRAPGASAPRCLTPLASVASVASVAPGPQDPNAICYAGVECADDEASQVGDFGLFTCGGARCLAQAGDGQPVCINYAYPNVNGQNVTNWVTVYGCMGGYVYNSPGFYTPGGTYEGLNLPSQFAADAAAGLYANATLIDLADPVGFRNGAVGGAGGAGWAAAAAAAAAGDRKASCRERVSSPV